MRKIKENAALKGLEIAEKDYKHFHQLAISAFEELDSQKDSAFFTIQKIENLASSVSNYPIIFKRRATSQLNEIRRELATYQEKEKIIREQRNSDMAAGAASVAALGVGMLLITSFKDFWTSKLKLSNKLGKNMVVWIAILLLCVITLFIYWVAKSTNKKRAAKRATKNTKMILSEISALKEKTAKAKELSDKLKETRIKIERTCFKIERLEGMKYKEISDMNQKELRAVINTNLGLAKLANTRID
jgi:hypothetical protein